MPQSAARPISQSDIVKFVYHARNEINSKYTWQLRLVNIQSLAYILYIRLVNKAICAPAAFEWRVLFMINYIRTHVKHTLAQA